MFAIFGHGNVAGLGEALADVADQFPTYRAQNEQAMAHAAIAFTKAQNRRRILGCTTSVGPGATNMVTPLADALCKGVNGDGETFTINPMLDQMFVLTDGFGLQNGRVVRRWPSLFASVSVFCFERR